MAIFKSDNSARLRVVFGLLFLAGLLFRLYSLTAYGMTDMTAYILWGHSANEVGLAVEYHGTYLPLQYQSFQFSDLLVRVFNLVPSASIKIVNLFFELCTLVLLGYMLRRYKKNPAYALLYWCHPWFLSISILGYIDIQYCFMILVMISICERATTWLGYVVAGIPLGLAFLMKPQAEVLILAGGMYIFFRGIYRKDWKPFGLTFAPTLLVVCYSFYFVAHGFPLSTLANSYINVAEIMPYISAQMMNLWFPFAYMVKQNGIVESDLVRVFGVVTIRHMAMAMTIGMLALYAYRLSRHSEVDSSEVDASDDTGVDLDWLYLLGYAALILPMLMTSAHENHAYLATLLFVLIMAMSISKIHLVAMQLFMLVQFVNTTGLYRMGNDDIPKGNISFWTQEAMAVGGVVSFICFLFIVQYYFFFAQPVHTNRLRLSALPSLGLIVIFPIIYMLVLHNNS